MPAKNPGLYEKFQKELSQNPEKKFELLALMGYLNQAHNPEVSGTANQFIEAFYGQLSKNDGSLNKEAFEQLFGDMADYRIKTVLEPASEFIRQDNKQHSDNWLYDHINSSKAGVIQLSLRNTALGFLMGMSDEISKVYGVDVPGQALEQIDEKKFEKLAAEEPEKTAFLEEAVSFFGTPDLFKENKSKEYLDQQKKLQNMEPAYSSDNQKKNFCDNMYKLFAEYDFSSLNDDEYRQIRNSMVNYARSETKRHAWTPSDPADKSVFELSTAIDGLSQELKDASGFRISDSSQFNALKDRVAEIQSLIKKGSSRENREDLFQSVTRLNQECQAYLDKNAGVRRTERGNRRKDIVSRLQNLAIEQTQKLLAPEAEQKMKAQLQENLKQAAANSANELSGSQYARDIEKLLVLNGETPEAAHNQLQDALNSMNGTHADLEKMGHLLIKCRHGLGQMDVRLEALKALGVNEPEALGKKEMKDILSSPENQDQLNDFYTSLHQMTARLSMNGTHPALQAVYRNLEINGKLEPDIAYERTSEAILKGFSGEEKWKAAREAYAAGDRSMDVTEMAALKASLGVQRSLVLENGTLSGQNRKQSELMENLAADTVSMIKETKEGYLDHSDAVKNLSLEQVMEGKERLTSVERAVAAAMSKNIEHGNQMLVEELGEYANLHEYQSGTGIHPLDRSYTVNHLMMAYMGMKGIDFHTALDDSQKRKEAAKDFSQFLENHQYELDDKGQPKTNADREKIEELAALFKSGQNMAKDIILPDIDYTDPLQRAGHIFELNHMQGFVLDIDQDITPIANNSAFQNAYGGKDKLEETRKGMFKIQSMLRVGVCDMYTNQLLIPLGGEIAATLYGEAIAGKKLRNIPNIFAKVDGSTLELLSAYGPTLYQNNGKEYLNHEKQFAFDDIVDSCSKSFGMSKEVFQPIKEAVTALKNTKKESEKDPKEKAPKQPASKKVKLNDLIQEEKQAALPKKKAENTEKTVVRPQKNISRDSKKNL